MRLQRELRCLSRTHTEVNLKESNKTSKLRKLMLMLPIKRRRVWVEWLVALREEEEEEEEVLEEVEEVSSNSSNSSSSKRSSNSLRVAVKEEE